MHLLAKRRSKVPLKVASLKSKGGAPLSDPFMAKEAVDTLNGMVRKAQERLDKKAIECKGSREQNQENMRQVRMDLTRLARTLTNLNRAKIAIVSSKEENTADSERIKEEQSTLKLNHERQVKSDQTQLGHFRADLQVTQYMLEHASCAGAPIVHAIPTTPPPAPVSTSGEPPHRNEPPPSPEDGLEPPASEDVADPPESGGPSPVTGNTTGVDFIQRAASMQIDACQGVNGSVEFFFKDSRLERSRASLTPQGRQLLGYALGRMRLVNTDSDGALAALRAAGMAYGSGLEDLDDGDDEDHPTAPAIKPTRAPRKLQLAATGLRALRGRQSPDMASLDKEAAVAENAAAAAATETQPLAGDAVAVDKAAETPFQQSQQERRCARAIPDCGVLLDIFAGLWGAMKDREMALVAKMRNDEDKFQSLNRGYNNQIQGLTSLVGEHQANLAETTTSITAESEQQMKKNIELRQLEEIEGKNGQECRDAIEDILYREICGSITVRNELITNALDTPYDEIADCEVTKWSFGDCSKTCDDDLVGGVQILTREPITSKSTYGADCPPLNMTKVCNQFKCPIDCKLSEWEEWSKCTKECGGGVQTRTRKLEVQPKNGGQYCDALQETQPCDSGSCDVDCELGEWTSFSTCSKVCDTGFKTRTKAMEVPARGDGTCPADTATERRNSVECNTQKCVGDEVCVSKQDIVLVLDGSGSVTYRGFDVLKEYAVRIVDRLRSDSYGHEAMKVAVVQFGNGKLDGNHAVSDAIFVQGLKSDLAGTKRKIVALQWQRGFTNLAQALMKASTILKRSSRRDAPGTVIVITDGAPSFKVQTEEAVKKLKEFSTLMIAQVKPYPTRREEVDLRAYVSEPSSANYLLVPGKKSLKANYYQWTNKIVVQMCLRAESPSVIAAVDQARGFRLKKEGQACAAAPMNVTTSVSAEACYEWGLNVQKDWATFSYAPDAVFEASGQCKLFAEHCKAYVTCATCRLYEPLAPVMPSPLPLAIAGSVGL